MEVLDSVAHSVRVKPENLRLAEVRALGRDLLGAVRPLQQGLGISLFPL